MLENDLELLRACIPPLTDWHKANRRSLPWRNSPTPYTVWISEIMLQQTRIEAVIPYYHRFLNELPDVAALAACGEDRLLKLWEGLGYYSRARNLKKAAEKVMADFGGELPRTAAELRTLPGIGDYTAGAIASIACGEGEPAVDGNVLRVVMRLLARGDDVLSQKTKSDVSDALRRIYPRGEAAGLLTEGLMELGETVCIPNGEARCLLCPLFSRCRAAASGTVALYPVRSAKKQRRIEARTVLLLRCGERYAIEKRPDKGLLAGLWQLPNRNGSLSEAELREQLAAEGLVPLQIEALGKATHIFTHVEWHMVGYRVELAAESASLVWKTVDELDADYAIPTAFRAYTKFL